MDKFIAKSKLNLPYNKKKQDDTEEMNKIV